MTAKTAGGFDPALFDPAAIAPETLRFNAELEDRVRARTAELEKSTAKLVESEQRRSMAIAAGKMGSWDWDWINGDWMWDEGQYRIFGVNPNSFEVTSANIQALLHPDDLDELRKAIAEFSKGARSYEAEFRVNRPDGEVRWCVGTAAATIDWNGRVVRVTDYPHMGAALEALGVDETANRA